LNFRNAAQRFEHGGGMFSVDRQHGDGANALWFGVWFEAYGKSANRAIGGQPVDAILHRTA
jgi:hypothetical protein